VRIRRSSRGPSSRRGAFDDEAFDALNPVAEQGWCALARLDPLPAYGPLRARGGVRGAARAARGAPWRDRMSGAGSRRSVLHELVFEALEHGER
jgi:hypothetical protein